MPFCPTRRGFLSVLAGVAAAVSFGGKFRAAKPTSEVADCFPLADDAGDSWLHSTTYEVNPVCGDLTVTLPAPMPGQQMVIRNIGSGGKVIINAPAQGGQCERNAGETVWLRASEGGWQIIPRPE